MLFRLAQILLVCILGYSFSAFPVSWLGPGKFQPLGNPKAKVGGRFYRVMQNDPESLNPINADDVYSLEILQYLFEGLMFYNEDTNEMMPGIAKSYTYNSKKNAVTFLLRKDVKWDDGHALTSEDVKFSFDILQDPKSKAEYRKGYLSSVQSVQTAGPWKVIFQLKGVHFSTLKSISDVETLRLIPKHIYGSSQIKRPSSKLTLTGSGPYQLKEYKVGRWIHLERRKDWWGDRAPHLKGLFKPQEIIFKIIPDTNLHMKLLEKEKIDYMALTETEFLKPPTKNSRIVKKRVENKKPKTYTFIAWNLKKTLFSDVRVRKALSLLLDRKTMAERFHKGYMELVRGPWSISSPYADQTVSALPYDPQKAIQLLDQAGLGLKGKFRRQKGSQKPFRFQLLYTSKSDERYFTSYQQSLARVGIQLDLKLVDWSLMGKAIETKNFDALYLSWHGGGVDNDPYQIWHSQSSKAGGSNFISYKNKKVDQWIERGRQTLNRKKRITLWKKIYKQIVEDVPYTFMLTPKYFLYGHTRKVKMKSPTLNYDEGDLYWWLSNSSVRSKK